MQDIHLASSVQDVPASKIRALADIAFPMEGVLKLFFGESNAPTPQFIKKAVMMALEDGYTYYTENAGLPSLRRAIADKYQEIHDVQLDPATEVVITASGVQALNVGIRCAIDPGDEALVMTPAWPNGSAMVRMFSGVPKEIPLVLTGKRYEIDFDRLKAAVTPRTKLLIYTSPSNPLGWVATLEDQQRLLDFCRRHGLWLLADEVYERLYYKGDVAPSILRKCTRDDAVLVTQSFSKSYCMTGWRLGWLVSRKDLAKKATELNEFIVSHAASMTQKAGEIALQNGEGGVKAMVAQLRENLAFSKDALSSMPGIILPEPEGAFYLFPKVEGLKDSFEFCRSLLLETRVGIAPGVAFGAGGEGSVRICFAADRRVLEPAMTRLGHFLDRWYTGR